MSAKACLVRPRGLHNHLQQQTSKRAANKFWCDNT